VEALVKEAEPAVAAIAKPGEQTISEIVGGLFGQGRLARGPKARTADRFSLRARLKEPTGPIDAFALATISRNPVRKPTAG